MGQSALALTIKNTSINIALTAFVAVVRRLLLSHLTLRCNFNRSYSIFMTLQGSNEKKISTADNQN